MLSDKKQSDRCLELFRTSRENVEAVCNKELPKILDDARKHRNREAHGGLVGTKEYKRRYDELRNLLVEMRSLIRDRFEEWRLLKPEGTRKRGGVYYHTAKILMGENRIFRKEKVETLKDMDELELYMLDTHERYPLELTPFFRIMPGPKTEADACYFYNRVEGDSVRLVSYHYEDEPEADDPNSSAVLKAISDLEG